MWEFRQQPLVAKRHLRLPDMIKRLSRHAGLLTDDFNFRKSEWVTEIFVKIARVADIRPLNSVAIDLLIPRRTFAVGLETPEMAGR